MKITSILESEYYISKQDIPSIHLKILNDIKKGIFDIDNANDKQMDAIFDLVDMGLIDRDLNLTDSGESVLNDEGDSNSLNSDMNHVQTVQDDDITDEYEYDDEEDDSDGDELTNKFKHEPDEY